MFLLDLNTNSWNDIDIVNNISTVLSLDLLNYFQQRIVDSHSFRFIYLI